MYRPLSDVIISSPDARSAALALQFRDLIDTIRTQTNYCIVHTWYTCSVCQIENTIRITIFSILLERLCPAGS